MWTWKQWLLHLLHCWCTGSLRLTTQRRPCGTELGLWEEKNPRDFGFKSGVVNNGGKQLIRNVFHCVISGISHTCVCAGFSSSVRAPEGWDQQQSSNRVLGCAGGGLWGAIPAAIATGATQPGTWDSPCAAWQGPHASATGAGLSCKSIGYFKCL